MTSASLNARTIKDLADMARRKGVRGWHSMRKEQLIRALLRLAKAKAAKSPQPAKAAPSGAAKSRPAAKAKPNSVAVRRTAGSTSAGSNSVGSATSNGSATKHVSGKLAPGKLISGKLISGKLISGKPASSSNKGHTPIKSIALSKPAVKPSPAAKAALPAKAVPPAKVAPPTKAPALAPKAAPPQAKTPAKPAVKQHPPAKTTPPAPKDPRILQRLEEVRARLERARDLACEELLGDLDGRTTKERLVLMVRGPFWLHAYWELKRGSVARAKAALGQDWHTARPVLRLMEVTGGHTSESVERLLRDIPIHGSVNNWYIDVKDSPKTYRVEIGYRASSGRFFTLYRSNVVTTPRNGKSGMHDEHWVEVAADYERVFAQSGGYVREGDNSQLRELFEERLGRPMGSPMVTRFGNGAQSLLNKDEGFEFDVDAEMIVFGTTRSDAYVTLKGEPVKVRDDGSFSIRLPMPESREVLPIVASSRDGAEERTVVLSVDRNTKIMEPVIRDIPQ